ncbi:hypothetical protein IBTHAUMO2_10004 [Nitrosopumilaceae archaeon]|nr:hypothetical protein IBTHAUMO2_10004 [Nitrosopumilaceae archaeon]
MSTNSRTNSRFTRFSGVTCHSPILPGSNLNSISFPMPELACSIFYISIYLWNVQIQTRHESNLIG